MCSKVTGLENRRRLELYREAKMKGEKLLFRLKKYRYREYREIDYDELLVCGITPESGGER